MRKGGRVLKAAAHLSARCRPFHGRNSALLHARARSALTAGVRLEGVRCLATAARLIGQPVHETHPHLVGPDELAPGISKNEFLLRRKRLAESMPDHSALLIVSNPTSFSARDIPYRYRQSADMAYYSGFGEPDSALLLERGAGPSSVTTTLYVNGSDPHTEMWEGARAGVEGAERHFVVDRAANNETLSQELQAVLGRVHKFFYRKGDNNKVDMAVRAAKDKFQDPAPFQAMRPDAMLESPRVLKSDAELALLRKSGDISARAMSEVMRCTKPGMLEDQLAGRFAFRCRDAGSVRLAYPCVVAGGINANTLHYLNNNQVLRDGDLVLMDAGGEHHSYASDITRTWPVNGKFTASQRELYDLVLHVNEACIDATRADGHTSLRSLHVLSTKLLSRGLRDLGILPPEGQDEEHGLHLQTFYPHSIGHYLGMDTHDTHSISSALPLQEGMVITIEPGLYIPHDSGSETWPVPERFRGIGIRIEDNIVVSGDRQPADNLTAGVPKKADEIERMMASP